MTSNPTQTDPLFRIGLTALNAETQKRYGYDAWQLGWDRREHLRVEIIAAEASPAAASDDRAVKRAAGELRLAQLSINPPECGCLEIEQSLDESGEPDPSTVRVAHACTGREVREMEWLRGDGSWGCGEAAQVDGVEDVAYQFDEDLDSAEYNQFSMHVHGRLICELTRPQRERLLDRYDAVQRGYADRVQAAAAMLRTTEECGCTSVGAVLRDDGTPDFSRLIRWHEANCVEHTGAEGDAA